MSMKVCPHCEKSYPDSERFCAVDGAALVEPGQVPAPSVGGSSAPGGGGAAEEAAECPVCGGRAQPGEEVCNFCGARLHAGRAPDALPADGPSHPALPAEFADERAADDTESAGGRSVIGKLGYALAALLALAAGAWLALHLTQQRAARIAAPPSPLASPAAVGPIVALARSLPVQVGGDSASASERSVAAARSIFEENKAALVEAYGARLAADRASHDAMLLSLRVAAGGEIAAAAVKTSTSADTSLDAAIVKAVMDWHFAPFSGGAVDVSYPLILARDAGEQADIEAELGRKMAQFPAGEKAEYAYAPPEAIASPGPESAPTGVAAPVPTPAAEVAALPTPAARPARRPLSKRRARPKLALRSVPTHPLRSRVEERLRSDKRLSRVKIYTEGGTVTLYGRVFDDSAKRLAERTVHGVDGVTKVVDTLATETALWADYEARINRNLHNVGLDKVTAKVIGPDAYLEGQVSSEAEKDQAVTIAETNAPVKVRTNLIRVVPRGMFGF